MALVEYSESDSSDTEARLKSHPPSEDNAKLPKASFRKVVDRFNPGRILVNLPEQSKPANPIEEDAADREPQAKKIKLGPNSFSGFNSILPTPKKSSATGHGNSGTESYKNGVKSIVSFKTGATPGFDRGAPVVEQVDGFDKATNEETSHLESAALSSANPPPNPNAEVIDHSIPEPSLKGNSMMFKPLSVARKTKKKSSTTTNEQGHVKAQTPVPIRKSESVTKISLFSSANIESSPIANLAFHGQYQPLIYRPSSTTSSAAAISEGETIEDEAFVHTGQIPREYRGSGDTPQSLSTIAEDLNLSASAKRQLLGRKRDDPSKINIANFNTDQEYAANEILRQAGEQVQHNPVRAIAPGKHSLKQLVNAVSSQKEALEEHFATGKRNKKEAGSKYGW